MRRDEARCDAAVQITLELYTLCMMNSNHAIHRGNDKKIPRNAHVHLQFIPVIRIRI